MFTATTYEQEFGYVPVEDDVERTNCTLSGRDGHEACGQHTCCGSPRFLGHVSGCEGRTNNGWKSTQS